MNKSHDSHIAHVFDSYCKTVIRNEARDIQRQYSRLRSRQLSLNNIPEDYLDFYQTIDHSIDNSVTFLTFGMEILVSNLPLAEAIKRLDKNKRKIILLFYFAGFNDREISQLIGMSLSGVWYKRKVAREEIRMLLEIGNYV